MDLDHQAEDEEIEVGLPEQIPPPDQALGPPVPPRPRLHLPPLQFLRTPPILKLDNDIDLYLRRFRSYVDSIGAQEGEISNILINGLGEGCLLAVERHLYPEITYDELTEILRRELGHSPGNREEYKAQLRKTMRGRNENVRKYFITLYNICKKAFPGPEAIVRDSALRDAFINGLGDNQISARLRENPDATNEEMLEQAALLINCKNASQNRHNQTVNATISVDDNIGIDTKMNTLIDLMTANAITQRPAKPNTTDTVTSPNQWQHNGQQYERPQYNNPQSYRPQWQHNGPHERPQYNRPQYDRIQYNGQQSGRPQYNNPQSYRPQLQNTGQPHERPHYNRPQYDRTQNEGQQYNRPPYYRNQNPNFSGNFRNPNPNNQYSYRTRTPGPYEQRYPNDPYNQYPNYQYYQGNYRPNYNQSYYGYQDMNQNYQSQTSYGNNSQNSEIPALPAPNQENVNQQPLPRANFQPQNSWRQDYRPDE